MTQFWTFLGIVLTLIGLIALVELRPRLSVTQEPPLEKGNIIPSFAVKNDGYLQLTDVSVLAFIRNAEGPGIPTFHDATSARAFGMGPEKVLEPTQTITSRTGINFGVPASAVKEIDLGIIVYYRPWPLTFIESHQIFRFVGHPTGDVLTWYKQVPADMEAAWEESQK